MTGRASRLDPITRLKKQLKRKKRQIALASKKDKVTEGRVRHLVRQLTRIKTLLGD